MKDKETQVGNGKRLVNTSGMRSDPICHENEEEALKAHCVFGELAVFHDSNRRMCNALVAWGEIWPAARVDLTNLSFLMK